MEGQAGPKPPPATLSTQAARVASQAGAFRRRGEIERCWCCSHYINIAQYLRRTARGGEMTVRPGRVLGRPGQHPVTIVAGAHPGASDVIEYAVTPTRSSGW